MASSSKISVAEQLGRIQAEVISCRRCPRLVAHREAVALRKRSAYLDWEYWGRPVPSFGDSNARLLIVGLAPGAHGANRTGRMFTGDKSGDFLYDVLHEAGFANHAHAVSVEDGLELRQAYITAPVRCAPPQNRPTREEFAQCRPFMEREIEVFRDLKVVVALGRLGFDSYLRILRERGLIGKLSGFPFEHGRCHELGESLPRLIGCYHPSQQNTQTGRLTRPMALAVFQRAAQLLAS